jgi:hypothetical protein
MPDRPSEGELRGPAAPRQSAEIETEIVTNDNRPLADRLEELAVNATPLEWIGPFMGAPILKLVKDPPVVRIAKFDQDMRAGGWKAAMSNALLVSTLVNARHAIVDLVRAAESTEQHRSHNRACDECKEPWPCRPERIRLALEELEHQMPR